MDEEPIEVRGKVFKTAILVELLANDLDLEAHRVAEILRDAAKRAGKGDYLQEVWNFLYQRDICSGKNTRVIVIPDL